MKEYEELSSFYEAIADNTQISAYHISLFITLLRLRSRNGWQNPIIVFRSDVLHEARMGRKTYNKCMGDLIRLGFLKYEPSNNPLSGSSIYFNKL